MTTLAKGKPGTAARVDAAENAPAATGAAPALPALRYTRAELRAAERELVAWIKPGTRRDLVHGTMAECPTTELIELRDVFRMFHSADRHRRADCADIVLASRARRRGRTGAA